MRKWLYIIAVLFFLWLIGYAVVGFLKGGSALDYSDKIAVIEVKGVISSSDGTGLFGESTVSSDFIIESLKAADSDKSVKGILLDINSPGGMVVASSTIAGAVKKMQKPVVAYIGEMGASGGYWVASAADKIVADPLSITGSVGVVGSYLEFSGLMEKYGVRYEKLAAGDYKEMGGPYQELSKEERNILEKKLGIIHDNFIQAIVESRKLSPDTVKEMGTGIFYLGEEAYERDMVDYLGSKDLAVNITRQLAKAPDAKIVEYKERKSIADLLEKVYANSFYFIGRGIGFEMMSRSESPLEIKV